MPGRKSEKKPPIRRRLPAEDRVEHILAQVLVVYSTTGPRKASVDALIRNLYRSEEQILRTSIEAGVRQGAFRRVDPAQAATFISTHLDGLFYVAMTRPDVDLRARTEAAWTEIWGYLGVQRAPRDREKRGG